MRCGQCGEREVAHGRGWCQICLDIRAESRVQPPRVPPVKPSKPSVTMSTATRMTPPCAHCGDPSATACGLCLGTSFDSCRLCHLEIAHGIIPHVETYIGGGTSAPAIPSSQRNYDGGRFHSGEW